MILKENQISGSTVITHRNINTDGQKKLLNFFQNVVGQFLQSENSDYFPWADILIGLTACCKFRPKFLPSRSIFQEVFIRNTYGRILHFSKCWRSLWRCKLQRMTSQLCKPQSFYSGGLSSCRRTRPGDNSRSNLRGRSFHSRCTPWTGQWRQWCSRNILCRPTCCRSSCHMQAVA